jgi:dolichol-phosphate mannosyltransferase
MNTKNIWIVIPAFNEASNLEKVLKAIKRFTPNIIIVDDGSQDQTAKIASRHTSHVLSHAINLGKGAALKTGCDYAFKQLHAEAIIMLDADGQHDPRLIPVFIKNLKTGHELLFGIRDLIKMPQDRRLGNQLTTVFIKLKFGVKIQDILCGYKAFSKRLYNVLRWQAQDYAVELEIAARTAKYKLPFTYIKVPTTYHPYQRGMNAIDAIKTTTKLLTLQI